MRIKDIKVAAVFAGKNWLLTDGSDLSSNIIDWEIAEASVFTKNDTIVYSGIEVFKSGVVRPLILVREVGDLEWWGDSCSYVNGKWQAPSQSDEWIDGLGEYIAMPLQNDPSFMGEYSHQKQRKGFLRWRGGLKKLL